MSVKASKFEPVKRQASLRSNKTKQDAKPSLVSPSSSIKTPRFSFASQKTTRRVASSAKDINNAHRTKISSSRCVSIKWTENFILIVELRKKIITFRTIIDLPSLTGYISITNMVMRTMKDLHKLCPEIIESSQIFDIRRADIDKLLDHFYNALKSIGDSWIDDHEWIIKSKYRNINIRKNLSDGLVEKVLAALDGLIKEMNERLNMTEIGNDEVKKKVSPQSKTSSESAMKQQISPPSKVGDFAISVSNLPRNVRMQTLVKLSPIDVKRLAIDNMCQKESQSNNGYGDNESVEEKKNEAERIEKMERAKEVVLEEKDSVKNQIDDKSFLRVSEKSENVPDSLAQINNGDGGNESVKEKKSETERTEKMEREKEAIIEEKDSVKNQIDDKSCSKVSEKPEIVPESLAQINNGDGGNESIKENKSETERTEKMERAKEASLEENDSVKNQIDDKSCSKVPEKSKIVQESLALPPLPPVSATLLPPPPLSVVARKGLAAPPPLPRTIPPPPPGAKGILGAKKVTGKLKRSTQFGHLYRFLKEKIEGKNPEARSSGACGGIKGGIGSLSARGKQGMADALAEITKKSAYFQQIESDVKMYMKAINELKTEICKFKSNEDTELQKFHMYVESVLDKLTDETQVLARCEGFPQKKLEAIRTASALYSKLQGMIKEQKNWKMESPANQLYDKTERLFQKIRREIETLDQIKVEEEKKFKSHNIHFNFSILIQIKELMVDVSSGCMELALKEKREAKIALHTAESRETKPSMKNNKTVGWTKMLWRAFQFAYKVYTFAGGHDDRADQLTRELADEIELILDNQSGA